MSSTTCFPTGKLNQRIQTIIDQHTEPWGVKVVSVEVKQVDLPESMLRAMAKQAEAEREKRSKIIHAEGEFNAAQKLVDAAQLLATQPMTLQLRYLQTLTEIGVEKNTTIVFPLPLEMMTLFNKMADMQMLRCAWRRGDKAGEIAMRSLFDTEEEEESKAAEITLSTASLLGIFFGLVLVCGVFFGFGYSMGRGEAPGAQAKGLRADPVVTPANRRRHGAVQPPAPRRRSSRIKRSLM